MKILKTASGKKTIKISKKEWQDIGRKAGWEATPEEIDDTLLGIRGMITDGMEAWNMGGWPEDKIEEMISLSTWSKELDKVDSVSQERMYKELSEWSEQMSKKYLKIKDFCESMSDPRSPISQQNEISGFEETKNI